MRRVSHSIDRVEGIFDDPTLVANTGLILPATLMVRLGLEAHRLRRSRRAWSSRWICLVVVVGEVGR